MNSTSLVIPAFFIFLGLEYLAAKKKGKAHLFVYENSVASLSIGIAERLLNLFITGSFYGLYFYIHQHYSLFAIPDHWTIWILLLLATDLVWYWYHRLGHEINFLWGAHVVHHQSEDFNYTVSARVTTLQSLVRNIFWCILPLLGFAPEMVIVILVIHGAYSFFTHTQVIGKLGWLENVLITPSHHGVHHASNTKYLNKNYGDIFVFWDKIFGTFQREEEKPVYGLTIPLKSHSFLWQHFHYYAELWEACRRTGSIRGSIRILFGKPEDLDKDIRSTLEKKLLPDRRQSGQNLRFRAYLNAQLASCLVTLFTFTLFFEHFLPVEAMLISVLILLTLIICGAMLEQRRWIYYLEVVRCQVFVAYISFESESFALFFTSLIFITLLIPVERVEQVYLQFLYGGTTGIRQGYQEEDLD